jgi:dihydrofolate synthase/folylpolyglutamate synthase
MKDEGYKNMLERLYSYHFHGLKPGLERISLLLKELGNPHLNYDYAHITGTNGKGSTAHYCAGIQRAEGKRVGLYTSPHLSDFRERIVVNGRMAEKDRLASILGELLKIAEKEYCSFFEIATALAFEYFKEEKVDVAVLEVGMGGRWDATNIVDSKKAIITNVSLEHTQYLGNTVEAIAYEKAGIIKEEANVVTCAGNSALRVIENMAKEKGAKLSALNRDFRCKPMDIRLDGNDFIYMDESFELPLKTRMVGIKQIENACAAVRLLRDCDKEAIKKGIGNAFVPGRFEVIEQKGKRIIIDGAHNPGAAVCLAQNVREFGIRPVLILGVLKDKNYAEICRALCPLSEIVVVTEPRAERRLAKEDLAKEAGIYSSVIVAESLKDAIDIAKSFERDICITGSLYLAGEARELLGLAERGEGFMGDF